MTDDEIDSYVVRVGILSVLVALPRAAADAIVPADPGDDPIIATAVNGRAEAICTLDRHFWHADVQSFCAGRGIRIVTDVELLAELRQAIRT